MREDQPSVRPSRVIIDRIHPQVDNGRFAVKGIQGDELLVRAVLLCDGHDLARGFVEYRHEKEEVWSSLVLEATVNDVFVAKIPLEKLGRYFFRVGASLDRYGAWRRDLKKRLEAKQEVANDIKVGLSLIETWKSHLTSKESDAIANLEKTLQSWIKKVPALEKVTAVLDEPRLLEIAAWVPDPTSDVRNDTEFPVQVEIPLAEFSSWYEFFPRSTSGSVERHGTFKDSEARLEYAAKLGFDIVYLPPIHPIGRAFRKGRNNSLSPEPDDVGSPWAIGGAEGGHKAILSELGGMDDFERFVKKARSLKLDVALDIAFQVSPDHPYAKEHPEWFKKRPDGTIQYAENPPKKYQDIYPFDFESEDWKGLWKELKSVVGFWVEKGVRVFRVDNPHTKSFHFWEWLIREVKKDHPEVLFLAEAFTRPHIMAYLAKAGFSQSYTYFTWRNTRWEFAEYMRELTQSELALYFRPNFWPNTPDILPEHLQVGGRPAFLGRLILAATLSSNYGIYGPAFELLEHVPREAHSEEYMNSEKYEIRAWDLKRPDSLAPVIHRINRIRRENPALHSNRHFTLVESSNEQLLCYMKTSPKSHNVILVVVNLDFYHRQSGMIEVPLGEIGLAADSPYEVHDLLSDARYTWQGSSNYVELDPHVMPAHVFVVKQSR